MSQSHYGHEPRAEEIALHQMYLTLERQIGRGQTRRLRSSSEPRRAGSKPIGE
jgi:hypothetical protein